MYTAEQQAENRKKWVDALRSGQYAQTEGWLRDEVGFCCLGVACDLYLQDIGKDWEYYAKSLERNKEDPNTELCPEVMEHFGIKSVSGHYKGDVVKLRSLASDNDGDETLETPVHPKTFQEIADIIESAPKGLFKEVKDA